MKTRYELPRLPRMSSLKKKSHPEFELWTPACDKYYVTGPSRQILKVSTYQY
jgi:hypothetical protein